MTWEMIGIVLLGITQLVALVGAYYGLKLDMSALGSNLSMAMLSEIGDRKVGDVAMKTDLGALITATEMSVVKLVGRVDLLESGQGEWTEKLRERTHELGNQVNVLVLKVDRLERPTATP